MATTKAKTAEKPKDQTQQQAPQQAPAAQLPATSPREVWDQFETELKARADEIGAMLPTHIPRDRFHAVAMAAIKQNPSLLRATARSLVSAITKAAQDGLMPDGREGFINVYNTKVKGLDGRDTYQDVAQWLPMAHGIRKRAKELDGILIDAQVVYLNDAFLWAQGDTPRIEHTPAKLGQPRGDKIGAYAIYKREDGTILHREVMDYGQIEKARSKSKAPDSLMWKDFPEEGYRKTVVRRGMKSVPVSEKLLAVVTSDDDNFDLSDDLAKNPVVEGQMIPPRPRESDFARQPEPKAAIEGVAIEKRQEPAQQAAQGPDGRPEPPPVGEEVKRQSEPAQAAQEEPQQQPEPVREPVAEAQPEDDEQPPSEAYMGASNWLDTAEAGIMDEKDLDDLKKRGRGVIDSFEGLTPDELDMLRGRFTTMVLVEQQRRGKKGKR
jgi:recombination protein RecT